MTGDIKNITRDPAFIMLFMAPVIILLFLRFLVPVFSEIISEKTGFSVVPYYDFIVLFFSFLPVSMAGVLAGLIIIDERDEGLIMYYSVTPIARKGYMLNKVYFFGIAGFVWSFLIFLLNGLYYFPFWLSFITSCLYALTTLVLALFLSVYAGNKVEALALSKFAGIIITGIPLVWFVPWPWKMAAFIFPTAFPAYILAENNTVPAILFVWAAGTAYYAVIIHLFYRMFEKKWQ